MKSPISLLVVVLCISFSFARPPIRVLNDLDGLKPTHPRSYDPSNPPRLTKSFHNIDWLGRGTHLVYDAQVAEGVHPLDIDSSVDSVTCNPDNSLTIGLASSDMSPDWQIGEILVGGPHWGCKNAQGVSATFLRLINSIQVVDSLHWTVSTTPVVYTDIFQNVDVSFKTSQHDMQGPPPEDEPVDTENQRSFKRIVHHLAKTVKHIIQGAIMFAKLIWDVATGRFDVGFNPRYEDLSWNYAYSQSAVLPYDYSTTIAGFKVDVGCNNCYMDLHGSVYFHLVVKDWKLKTLSTGMQDGGADIMTSGEISARNRKNWSHSQKLASLGTGEFPEIVFYLGPIPITIDFSVDITARYDISVAVEGSLLAQAQVSGGFTKIAIEWNPSRNAFDEIFEHKFITKGTFQRHDSVELNAQLTLTPKLNIIVENMVTLALTISPYVDVRFAGSTQAACLLQLTVSTGISAQFEIQFALVIEHITIIPRKTWGPWNVYGPKQSTLINQCLRHSSKYLELESIKVLESLPAPQVAFLLDDVDPEIPPCPSGCSGFGTCSLNGTCTCYDGYGGQDCSQQLYVPPHEYTEFTCPSNSSCVSFAPDDLPTCASSLPSLSTQSICAQDGLENAKLRDALIADMLEGFRSRGPKCYDNAKEFLCGTHFPVCLGDAENHIQLTNASLCEAALTDCLLPRDMVDAFCDYTASSSSNGLAYDPHPAYTKTAPAVPRGTCQPTSTLPAGSMCGSMLSPSSHVFVYSSLFQSAAEADAYSQFLLMNSTNTDLVDLSDPCSRDGAAIMCAMYLPECDPTSDEPAPLSMCQSACTSVLNACPSNDDTETMCDAFEQPLTASYISPFDYQCGYKMLANVDAVFRTPGPKLDLTIFGITVGGIFVLTTLVAMGINVQRKKVAQEGGKTTVLVPLVDRIA